jgi:hypothetical protein
MGSTRQQKILWEAFTDQIRTQISFEEILAASESKITEERNATNENRMRIGLRTKTELHFGIASQNDKRKFLKWDKIGPRFGGIFSKLLNRPSVLRAMTLWKCNQKIRGDIAIHKVLLDTRRVKLDTGSHNPECCWWTPRYSLPPGALTCRVHT